MTPPPDFFACDFFALFGLSQKFALDESELAAKRRELQAAAHPDRFAGAGDAQLRVAAQMAARVNEAGETLRRPLARAAYLLKLRGADAFDETNTAMPPDFLMKQLERREAADEARRQNDLPALAALRDETDSELRVVIAEAAELLDNNGDLQSACDAVRRWKYLEKLSAEIQSALPSHPSHPSHLSHLSRSD